jgi:two-component system CheB/CheR fusion protein
MRVVVWNQRSEELWGLRADEATGSDLTGLDIGLPVSEIRPLIGNSFVDPNNAGEAVVDAVNRRGRPIRVRVTCAAFRADEQAVNGALLLMEVQR